MLAVSDYIVNLDNNLNRLLNSRPARLVATLMAYQAGLPGIDFSFIGGRGKEFQKYIRAIQEDVRKNYDPMTEIVLRALRRAVEASIS